MPHVTVDDGIRLHYVDVGEGPETVVLTHSYLVDHTQYEAQIAALSKRYRVLAYDHRGHGGSDKPHAGYAMERLYADGVAFLEAMDAGPVHWIGLSTGGFVGMRIAFRRPELLKSVVLMDTSAMGEPTFNRVKYGGLFVVLRLAGFRPVIGAAMKAMFGPAFLKDPARSSERQRWQDVICGNDPRAIVAFGLGIFGRDDVLPRMREVTVPALVVVGEHDRAIPVAKARALADAIPGARLEVIPRAGHLCTIEEPERVNDVIERFLSSVTA